MGIINEAVIITAVAVTVGTNTLVTPKNHYGWSRIVPDLMLAVEDANAIVDLADAARGQNE
jgi:hypothetical protein